jgi:hypothetical protein
VGGLARAVTEPCVFVLWESARPSQRRILDDLARRFDVHDVLELTWPAGVFSRNLTRLYGEALPQGSDKEHECGTGPFLVVVASDSRPRYATRRTTRGLRRVNKRAARAKSRYRRWTGGGFRVHGSLDRVEAERDLRLLLREGPGARAGRRWDGVIRPDATDPVGWADTRDLVASVEAATPASLAGEDGAVVHIVAEDVWWATVIAGGDPPPADARAAHAVVSIGARPRTLRVTAPEVPSANE